MLTESNKKRQVIVASILSATMIGLVLFVFDALEVILGHSIAIASFAATITIISFNPSSASAHPKTITFSYLLAALIGFLIGFLPIALIYKAVLGVGLLIALLITVNRMHPPAIAYLFGFILEQYGLNELLFTIPALIGFFIALAVVAFLVEHLSFFWQSPESKKKIRPTSLYERIELLVDKAIPYALVVLFVSIFAEFIYPEQMRPYDFQLTVLDWSIILLFVADLTFKFRQIGDWKIFAKKYWLEIIATIPFFIVFRAFQGLAFAFEFIARGAVEIPIGANAFFRFLRPLARFPRFARMLEHLEGISSKK